jgi:hypothetical protein
VLYPVAALHFPLRGLPSDMAPPSLAYRRGAARPLACRSGGPSLFGGLERCRLHPAHGWLWPREHPSSSAVSSRVPGGRAGLVLVATASKPPPCHPPLHGPTTTGCIVTLLLHQVCRIVAFIGWCRKRCHAALQWFFYGKQFTAIDAGLQCIWS